MAAGRGKCAGPPEVRSGAQGVQWSRSTGWGGGARAEHSHACAQRNQPAAARRPLSAPCDRPQKPSRERCPDCISRRASCRGRARNPSRRVPARGRRPPAVRGRSRWRGGEHRHTGWRWGLLPLWPAWRRWSAQASIPAARRPGSLRAQHLARTPWHTKPIFTRARPPPPSPHGPGRQL